jgi:hypothetical protein
MALAAQSCRPGASLLPRPELAQHLAALPGWKHAPSPSSRTGRIIIPTCRSTTIASMSFTRHMMPAA